MEESGEEYILAPRFDGVLEALGEMGWRSQRLSTGSDSPSIVPCHAGGRMPVFPGGSRGASGQAVFESEPRCHYDANLYRSRVAYRRGSSTV